MNTPLFFIAAVMFFFLAKDGNWEFFSLIMGWYCIYLGFTNGRTDI